MSDMENLQRTIQIFILGIWLFIVPVITGGCFYSFGHKDKERCSGRVSYRVLSLWVSGQMLLWAAFQLVCVPFVLLEREFSEVADSYGVLAGILGLWGLAALWRERRFGNRKRKFKILESKASEGIISKGGADRELMLLAVAAAVLLAFQLVQAVRLAYSDGDDAYYVAVSTITDDAGTMYRKIPYTGGTTQLDIRHGLAPFPVWISFLARVSGLKPVGIAHVAVSFMLIPMAYAIYYLLAQELFPGKRRQQLSFMVLTEVLVLFGDYSFYTVEHFMIARSRQGKAALGSIILPALFWLLLLLMKRIQENKKIGLAYWVLVASVMTAGCLCTTLGAFLLCLLLGIAVGCGAVVYRRWKLLIPMAICCLPCVCFAGLYLLA